MTTSYIRVSIAFLVIKSCSVSAFLSTNSKQSQPPLDCSRHLLHVPIIKMSPNDVMTRSEAFLQPLLFPLAFAACFRIGAAISVINQPRLPPNDENPVSTQVIRLPSLGSRVKLFYPCQVGANTMKPTASYCTDGRATSDGMAGLVGFKQLGLSFLLAHLADAESGCYEHASQLATINNRKAPLLIYSHGYGGNMDMATYFLRAIASQGIVVAALEHTDGTASSTVLSDGKRLDFDPSLYSAREGLQRRADELLEASTYLPNILPNTNQIFLGGHSYGAPSVILASQSTTAISGLILHDPALSMGYGQLSLPPRIPTISYTSDEYNRAGVECGDATYHVQGAFHGNFVDAPLWAPLWVMRFLSLVIPACGPADPNQVYDQLAESAKAFVANPLGKEDGLEQSLFERIR